MAVYLLGGEDDGRCKYICVIYDVCKISFDKMFIISQYLRTETVFKKLFSISVCFGNKWY